MADTAKLVNADEGGGTSYGINMSTDEKRPFQEYLEFEFDLPSIVQYNAARQKCVMFSLSCIPVYGWLAAPFLACYSCNAYDNARDEAMVRNLRVTREEIIYTVGRHKSGWRSDCSEVGTVTKSVPVDRLQDVLLKEPAGGCVVKEVLTRAEVQTAANSGYGKPTMDNPGGERAELSLAGLKQPHKFRDLVLGLKKNHDVDFRAFVCDGIILNGENMGAAVISEPLRGERPLGTLGVSAPHFKNAESKLAVLAEEQISLLKSIDNSLKVIASNRTESR